MMLHVPGRILGATRTNMIEELSSTRLRRSPSLSLLEVDTWYNNTANHSSSRPPTTCTTPDLKNIPWYLVVTGAGIRCCCCTVCGTYFPAMSSIILVHIMLYAWNSRHPRSYNFVLFVPYVPPRVPVERCEWLGIHINMSWTHAYRYVQFNDLEAFHVTIRFKPVFG